MAFLCHTVTNSGSQLVVQRLPESEIASVMPFQKLHVRLSSINAVSESVYIPSLHNTSITYCNNESHNVIMHCMEKNGSIALMF